MNSTKSENRFISFYGENQISPVRQDISDFCRHLERREKLYRLLGLPTIVFRDRRIVEVGPGGGYNALAALRWGASIDFVEPNTVAQDELTGLMKTRQIPDQRWSLFKGRIEDFRPGKAYELVIAEGFLPGLSSREDVIRSLDNLVAPGGVIVVTTIDDLSFLMEFVRRLVGARLLWQRKANTFKEKLTVLSKAFAPHLAKLKHASRPVEDWVADSFLNTTIYAEWFGIDECINEFGSNYHVMGSSPHMFSDYSWYKDVDFDSRAEVLRQFEAKRHMLMLCDMRESERDPKANRQLCEKALKLRRVAGEMEAEMNDSNAQTLADLLNEISQLSRSIDKRISEALDQGVSLLRNSNLTDEKLANADAFAGASGRTQQYLSLVKAIDYSSSLGNPTPWIFDKKSMA